MYYNKYDANGNITNYNGTVFGYDSVIKDKLVSVGGNAVTYASASSLNPTSWNGRSYGYEGRRLTSFNGNGKSCTYDYDEQSHRISKSVNGAVTRYIYSGDNLVIEDGPNGKLFFLYDENGQLYGFVKDGKRYFYIKDITGTILGIADENRAIVGKYSYTAYGKCTVTKNKNNIAEINPFRFKCYYYDTESGMYYCQTRYFVPEWGRWLNTDNPGFLQFDNINGMNLFAYCNNNPVMYSDPSGQFVFGISALIGALIGGIFGAIEGAISAKATGRDVGCGIVLGFLGGAIVGGVAGGLGASGMLTGMKLIKAISEIGALSLVVGGATEYFNQKINNEPTNWGNIVCAGIKSAASNVCSFLFANYLSTISKDAFDIFGTTLGTSIIFFGINLMFNAKDFYEYGKKLKEKY